MSAGAEAPTRPEETAPLATSDLDGAADRGRLTIADRVIEKIAAQSVAEIDEATGAPRRVLGQTLGAASEDTRARTSATVDGKAVTVDVSMSVRWPASVIEVTRRVREHITGQIMALTGLEVVEIDIDVPTLLTEQQQPPRVR